MRKTITKEAEQRAKNGTDSRKDQLTSTKFALLLWCLFLSVSVTHAQNPGPFYRQFNFNPYLFNPAYVGINNQIEASVVYRQQWANFKDAPMTAGASIQLPESDRVALGFQIMTDKQVLLQHSNFIATFGYVLPLAPNQSIRFGLSGGVGLNKLNLDPNEMNSNDPVITRASGTNYYVDGNFGVVYSYEGLRIGFALTDFFKSDPFNPETFNQFKMSNLRNRLFSASYKFNVGAMQEFALEPYALYRQTTDGAQDYFEVATVAYYKDKIWAGASYTQHHGLGAILGMTVKDKFRFGYSYDFSGLGSNMASGGAHELHIGIRLASRKVSYAKNGASPGTRVLANEQSKQQPKDYQSILERPRVLEEPTDSDVHQPRLSANDPTLTSPKTAPSPENAAPANAASPEKVKPADSPEVRKAEPAKPISNGTKARENFTLSSGRHYVVIGVYKSLAGSMSYMKQVRSRGYQANVALNPRNNFYYVYIHSNTNIEEARKKRNEYKLKNWFKEAWLFSME